MGGKKTQQRAFIGLNMISCFLKALCHTLILNASDHGFRFRKQLMRKQSGHVGKDAPLTTVGSHSQHVSYIIKTNRVCNKMFALCSGEGILIVCPTKVSFSLSGKSGCD